MSDSGNGRLPKWASLAILALSALLGGGAVAIVPRETDRERVRVLEVRVDGMKERLEAIDGKLDRLLERTK